MTALITSQNALPSNDAHLGKPPGIDRGAHLKKRYMTAIGGELNQSRRAIKRKVALSPSTLHCAYLCTAH
jgi:hypothetical protein